MRPTAKNYTGTISWKYSQARRHAVRLECDRSTGNRTENDQIKTAHTSSTPSVFCGGASRQQRLRLRRRQARLSARHGRHRCLQHDALQCRRLAQRGRPTASTCFRTRWYVRQPRQFQRHDAGRRAHGFRRLRPVEEQLFHLARGRQCGQLRSLRSRTPRTVSTGGDRFSPKITVGVTPVAGFTPYVSYAEGYRAPSITETLIAGEHATGGGPPFFPCPGGTVRIVLLPAESEPAAGGRQEQGSRHQPEV